MRLPAFFFLFVGLLHSHHVVATHLRAADIIVEQQCGSLTYKITIQVYMNTASSTPFGGFTIEDGSLDFGDGSTIQIIPQTAYTVRPDLGQQIGVAVFSVFHTYTMPGEYKISYFERDRSAGVVNIPNSHDVPYSTYAIINAQSTVCNNFPVLLLVPLDRACRGVAFFHSPGATDADGDSISYALAIPEQSSGQPAFGYVPPDDPSFYLNFQQGNEANNGPPSFVIDPVTGLITWDAPGASGEYNIAFKVIEWKKDLSTGTFVHFSTTIRDMQIVVEDCDNKRPTLTVPQNLCVEAGTVITGTFTGTDPDSDPVKIEVVSTIFGGPPERKPATYDPVLTDYVPSIDPVIINFEWRTDCIHVREQAYQVIIKITDKPASGPAIVTIKTWNIKVIAPAPKWVSATVDLVNRSAALEWEGYDCSNAQKMQLWRKVGSHPFTPGKCTAGLSIHKGYTLVKEFDPSINVFEDTNNGQRLAVGAQYCYRLVAVFGAPGNGKSYVSSEWCVGPILADAPVITNVSVLNTSRVNGEIEVKWLKPFDISREQYPEPYEYEIFRSDGFTQSEGLVNVSGRVRDVLSFIDRSVNNMDSVYNYQIVLYSRTQDDNSYHAIDTSEVASSVQLGLTANAGSFTLKWAASVPWSNVTEQRPYHRIYRGVAGNLDSELVLIDSVEVSEFGFEYEDIGRFENRPIREDVFYCYSVETIGTYGNDAIPLMLNRSQMACSYPVNNLPVCVPLLAVKKTDCEEFIAPEKCESDFLENEISWSFPETSGCRMDVTSIRLYFSPSEHIDLDILQTMYVHKVLSLARCYRIAAVDAAGHESLMSDSVCNDNCPSYELPNVFTPNDDGCNDFFSAYIDDNNTPLGTCDHAGIMRCPRFVKSVHFKVINRWGRLLYEYQSDEDHSVNINWNGRDLNGDRLEAGIYYYIANVEFEAFDPDRRYKTLKGAFHIVL